MSRLSDERLTALLATVTRVGPQLIPPNTPCFWDNRDRVACTYDDLRPLIVELQERRADTKPVTPAGSWGVFDTHQRRWCPRRGSEEEMGAHAVKLNGAPLKPTYRYQPLPLPGADVVSDGAGLRQKTGDANERNGDE